MQVQITRAIPCERDLDVVLIHREPQIQQLQLAIVTVQQIATGSAVLASSSHILAEAVEGRTFLTVSLGVFPIGLSDVILEGLDPIDLVGLLERAREHR